jgi:DNA-binding SARP family transcriptional activator/tetratricopeptide (TPR) repeat protein
VINALMVDCARIYNRWVRFALLGEVRAWTDDDRPLPLGTPQQRATLAVLLLEPRRLVPVSRLIEAIWGDRPPASALKTLHGYVYRLRRSLQDQPGVVLRGSSGGYLLETDPQQIDLHRFRGLVAAAEAGDDHARVALLADAVALWRGSAMADTGSALLRSIAAGLEEERLAALEGRLAALVRLGRHADCVAELTQLVAAHPLREQSRAQLMLALFRCGRQGDALALYRAGRDLLVSDLGVEPGPELRRLHEQMLRGDPQLTPPRPDPHPTHASAAPYSPATGRGRPAAPFEVPHDVAGFTGRGGALAELDALLATVEDGSHGGAVITAIDGLGGVGKTALVAHWAHRVRARFPDGVLWLDLRGYDPHQPPLAAGEALAQLLRGAGMPAGDVPDDPGERARVYRSALAGGRWLVVLDSAGSAEQVRPLLPGSGSCLSVVTGRTVLAGLLATEGAHRIPLQPLRTREATTLLGAILGAPRLAAEPQAATDLAGLCGHLPLALRVAAANVLTRPGLSLASYVAEFGTDRLGGLGADRDPSAALRTTLDLSYRALPEPARRVFTLLGAYPGADTTVPAAAALAGWPAANSEAALAQLCNAHLLEEHTTGRYRMHDVVRAYAAERANAEHAATTTAALRRLRGWCLSTTRRAVRQAGLPRLLIPADAADSGDEAELGFDDDAAAMSWLESERPNLVALVCVTAEHDLDPATWRIALELRGFLRLRRYATDWLSSAQAALSAAQRAGTRTDQAASWHNVGHARWSVGEYPAAIDCYQHALADSRAAGWPAGVAGSLSALGSVYHDLGQHADAIEHYQQALAIEGDPLPPPLRLITLGSLGLVYQTTGRLPAAIDCFTQVLELAERAGADDFAATSLGNLGMIHTALGNLTQARDLLDRALHRYRQVGSRNGEANVLASLAMLNTETGHHDDGAYQATLAVRIARDIGDRRIECDALAASGTVSHRHGDLPAARNRLQEAIDIGEAIGYARGVTDALSEAAAVDLALGNPASAAQKCERALDSAHRIDDRVAQARARTVRAQICLAQMQYDAARQHARSARQICRELGLRLAEADALATLAAIVESTHGSDAAQPYLTEAAALTTAPAEPPQQLHPRPA